MNTSLYKLNILVFALNPYTRRPHFFNKDITFLQLNFFCFNQNEAYFKPNTMKSYRFMPFLCFKLKSDNKIENGDPTIFCPLK